MQGTSPHNPSPCEHLPAGAFCVRCGYFASGLGNGVVNMIGGALRQLVVLVPCLWLLIRFFGVDYAWFAFLGLGDPCLRLQLVGGSERTEK